MNKKCVWYSFVIMLLILPGCGRVVDWAKGNFNQGETFSKDSDITSAYVKSVTVYDQFTTRGMFDVLWLADQVRTEFSDLHMRRYGKNQEQYNIFLRRQLEENNHFISFLILTPYEMPLGTPDAQWAVFLQVNGNNFSPKELKAIELSPEYKTIFGKKFNRFKIPYVAKFDAKDLEDRLLITPDSKELKLYFRTTDKQTTLTWSLDNRTIPNAEMRG